MNTLSKEGKLDEAVLAVQNMEKRGIVGSAALYYDLARCLCSAGRCQEALMQVPVVLSLFIFSFWYFLPLYVLLSLNLVFSMCFIRRVVTEKNLSLIGFRTGIELNRQK